MTCSVQFTLQCSTLNNCLLTIHQNISPHIWGGRRNFFSNNAFPFSNSTVKISVEVKHAHRNGNVRSELYAIMHPFTSSLIGPTKFFSAGYSTNQIGHFWVPKNLTFKMRLGAQHFLWKRVLFVWEWKMISVSKAEHQPSFWNRRPGELGNGLFIASKLL